MLDLQFLEALVDEALAGETEASLKEWLNSQREMSLFSYYGSGTMEEICIPQHRKMSPNNRIEIFDNDSNMFNYYTEGSSSIAA